VAAGGSVETTGGGEAGSDPGEAGASEAESEGGPADASAGEGAVSSSADGKGEPVRVTAPSKATSREFVRSSRRASEGSRPLRKRP
jgi:hypothetical protein